MAQLDYTNIAGSAFQPYVATQIEKRKALVNKDYRSSSELNCSMLVLNLSQTFINTLKDWLTHLF